MKRYSGLPLVLILVVLWSSQVACSQRTAPERWSEIRYPMAGAVLAIDPELTFGEMLAQSWRNIDQHYKQVRINGRPLSKVNFELQPQVSQQGAVVEIQMRGTSVGATKSLTERLEIHSDSLTQFKARQMMMATVDGLAFSDLALDVNSNQSLRHVKTRKRSPSAIFEKIFVNNAPKKMAERAQPIARLQVQSQLEATMHQMQHRFHSGLSRLWQNQPQWLNQGWAFSSDSRRIYVSSGFVETGGGTGIPNLMSPVSLAVHQDYLTELANQWRDQELSSDRIKMGLNGLNLMSSRQNSEDEWAIVLAGTPFRFQIEKDGITVRVSIKQFRTEKRVIENVGVELRFEPNQSDSGWMLKRDRELKIDSAASGARQQVVRSIVRKRLTTVLPEAIAIPNLVSGQSWLSMDLGLRMTDVKIHRNTMVVSWERL